jgi:hypothetical protein
VAEWLEDLVGAALNKDRRHSVVLELSRDPRGRDFDGDRIRQLLVDHLRGLPELRQAWQVYSWDKRWSPSPYLEGTEVGLYDSGYRDVEHHSDAATACAAFIAREVDWLRSRHPDPHG